MICNFRSLNNIEEYLYPGLDSLADLTHLELEFWGYAECSLDNNL